MTSSNFNPQIFIDQAKKLENSSSIFEYLIKDISTDRYEKISELYYKAGNIYKISDKEKAIECFEKTLHYNSLSTGISNELNKKYVLPNIAELYSKINYTKSIECYEQIINYYLEKGDIYNIIKYYEIIGDLYWVNNSTEEAKEIYKKTLHLINSNLLNIYSSTKKKIGERLCEILLDSNNSVCDEEASKIYFDLAEEFVNNKLLVYQAKKYILLGLLVDCARDDMVKAKIDLEKYSSIDYTFKSSREGKFIEKLFMAIESNNLEELSFECVEYDKITSLDNIQVKLLLRIKNLIVNIFNDSNSNDILSNLDQNEEIDLS
jgi:tetratricopeptide (TPR) repeat protein